jgi:hypothetical protein
VHELSPTTGQQVGPTLEQLEDALIDFSDQETFLLADALDECKDPGEVLGALHRVVQNSDRVRTFISSRKVGTFSKYDLTTIKMT